ncbi:MAG: response regulator transcription factor [Propionibacteriaceae bacterium]
MVRCLIVDDSLQFLKAARGWLEREEITVVGVASTVAQALQLVEELDPDVVLVDIDLGGESGFELASQLQRKAGANSSPVILISAYGEEDYAELIAASPVIGFLPKTALSGQRIRDLVENRAGQGV